MGDKLFGVISKHPIWVILVSLVIAFTTAFGAQNLVFRSDFQTFFDKDNPQLLAYELMQKVYNKSDNISFVVVPKGNNVFSAEHLGALEQLTKESWQVPYSTRVESITNFQHTFSIDDNLIVENLVENTGNLTKADLGQIRSLALQEPNLVNKLVSASGHVSVVNVTVKLPGAEPTEEMPEVASSVRAIKAKFLKENPGSQIYLSGTVMLDVAFNEAATDDGETLIPLMFLVVIITIGLMLRTISGTFATVLVVFLSIASTMGLAGWLGFYLSGPSSSAPTMILTLAVADCVHILTSMFYEMRQGADKRSAITRSLQINLRPIFLTSITTAVGFLSMNYSDIPPYRDLGNMVAMGAMFAFIFSVTIFPALLMVLPIKVKAQPEGKKDYMSMFAGFVIAKRKLLLPLVSVAILGSTAFITNNELNDDFVKYFDDSVPFKTATDFMQDNLSGLTIVEVSVNSGSANGINSPAYLTAVDDFSQWMRQQPKTDHVNTLTDTLKRLNKNMHGDDPTWNRLPDSQEMAAQYLLLYEMSLPYGLDLNNQINVDKSSAKITVTFTNLTSNELIGFENAINLWFRQNAPEYTLDIAGPSLIFAHMSQESISSMITGTVVALFVISLILSIALKSWSYGVISLIPNLLPAAVAFGLWGLIDGQVGMSLSVVLGMTLGIVVDDTVHFLSKYLLARRENGADPATAVRYAFANVGRALWITTFVLVAGFSVLAMSTFKFNAYMGMLTAITILIALIIDFLFLPPLLIAIDNAREKVSSRNEAGDQSTINDANPILPTR
mgnify:CR=1 FL=1